MGILHQSFHPWACSVEHQRSRPLHTRNHLWWQSDMFSLVRLCQSVECCCDPLVWICSQSRKVQRLGQCQRLFLWHKRKTVTIHTMVTMISSQTRNFIFIIFIIFDVELYFHYLWLSVYFLVIWWAVDKVRGPQTHFWGLYYFCIRYNGRVWFFKSFAPFQSEGILPITRDRLTK